MAKYKHLSIRPDDFDPIERLTKLFNDQNKTDMKPPKIVVMAARKMLADMETYDDTTGR